MPVMCHDACHQTQLPALQEELLAALGPEARATARATFGRGLNRVTDPQEIIDVLNVSGWLDYCLPRVDVRVVKAPAVVLLHILTI